MAIAKRIFLFLAVNILIMTTVTIVMTIITSVFGIKLEGMSYMIVLYSLLGFGGAFISLMISKWMAVRSMGVQIIDPKTAHGAEREILEMVYSFAQKAKLPKMPEVGIYDSPEVNAFATGPSKSNSLVAVSTGLLNRMDKDAVEGVIGHEVAHIANGDMVTMTLIQGVINTMVLIAARLIASVIAGNSNERERSGLMELVVFNVLQIVLSILGSFVVSYFSRQREYRADAGGARLAGRDRMLSGLRQLQTVYGHVDDEHQGMATLKISGHSGGLMALLSTHPPIEERIRRLETMPL